MIPQKPNRPVRIIILCLSFFCLAGLKAQTTTPAFKVIAFYTGKNDLAHISYVHEANRWFPKIAAENDFSYDSTTNWDNLNARFLAQYQRAV